MPIYPGIAPYPLTIPTAIPAAGSFPPQQVQTGRYSEPFSLRGSSTFIRLLFVIQIGLWLIRDSSLTSFLLYSVFIGVSLYFLIVRGEPFSLALVVESAASLAAKASTSTSASSSTAAPTNTFQRMSSPPTNYSNAPKANVFAKSASSSSSLVPKDLNTSPATPTGPPVFHDSDSMKNPHNASPLSTNSAPNLTTPTGADSNSLLPQTPSVEPVITPLPQRPDSTTPSSVSSLSHRLATPNESTPVVIAGATARHSSHDDIMSWTRALGSSYEVRVGPNYKKYGKKAPSKGALYECVGVDVFGAPDGKLDHIASQLQLPWIARPAVDHANPWKATCVAPNAPEDDPAPPQEMDPITKASDHYEVDPAVLKIDAELGVPTMFIVNFQIPTYAPGWMSSKEDGEGFSILLYYQITEATRNELRSGQLSGAVQLLKDFVNNAHAFEYHSRFKAIPRIVNPSEANVGIATRHAIKMYNSKPFLTGPHCHQFIRGPGYMEADIDVHRFCLAARKGAYGTMDALSSLVVDIGFVIEAGRDGADDELPEMILGCNRVAHLDPLQARSLQSYVEIGKNERAKRLAQQQQ